MNHLRSGTNISGKIPGMLFFDENSWYSLTGEWNITSLWLKDLKPRKNEYTTVISLGLGQNNLTLASLLTNSAITLSKNANAPTQTDNQTAISATYNILNKNSMLEIQYVFNSKSEGYSLKNTANTTAREIMHSIKTKITTKNEIGFFTAGLDANATTYKQEIQLEESSNPYTEVLKGKIGTHTKTTIIPVYTYIDQEIRLSEKTATELGITMLLDLKDIKKDPAIGPYLKLTTELLGIKTTFSATQRFTHIGLKPFSNDLEIKQYSTAKNPKSIQARLTMEKEPFGTSISYYDFYDQPENNLNINPLQEIINKNDLFLDENTFKQTILLQNPEIANDEEAMRSLDSLAATLPEIKQQIYSNTDKYTEYLEGNQNRIGISLETWMRTQNAFLSAALSKTYERGTKTPYSNDVNLILKAHTHINLEELLPEIINFKGSKNITLSAYAEYSTGRPFQKKILNESIAEEFNIKENIELQKENIPIEYYNILTMKRQTPIEGSKIRYPPSMTTSLAITWDFEKLFDILNGSITLYVIDPHLRIKGVNKNTLQLYYKAINDPQTGQQRLDLYRGKGPGTLPGFSIKAYF